MRPLPTPPFFDGDRAASFWPVPYLLRAKEAKAWAKQYSIQPAALDTTRVCLLLIDVQNTFCLPEFELFVSGAIDDNIRLCEFIYRNLGQITDIFLTLDTHTAMQIFHPIFWVNQAGEHPLPATIITYEDVKNGVWLVNRDLVYSLNNSSLPEYVLHYVKKLSDDGKYPLTVWPYHSMLGGIGHALVSAVEEAIFFHNIARNTQAHFEIKGNNPLTENYSVLRPEVLEDEMGKAIALKNTNLLAQLLEYDAIIIAGQAKSHCLAWTVEDLLTEIISKNVELAKKVYLLEDCTSPVVIPEVVDFTAQAEAAFTRFVNAGMQPIKSTDFPIKY